MHYQAEVDRLYGFVDVVVDSVYGFCIGDTRFGSGIFPQIALGKPIQKPLFLFLFQSGPPCLVHLFVVGILYSKNTCSVNTSRVVGFAHNLSHPVVHLAQETKKYRRNFGGSKRRYFPIPFDNSWNQGYNIQRMIT